MADTDKMTTSIQAGVAVATGDAKWAEPCPAADGTVACTKPAGHEGKHAGRVSLNGGPWQAIEWNDGDVFTVTVGKP